MGVNGCGLGAQGWPLGVAVYGARVHSLHICVVWRAACCVLPWAMRVAAVVGLCGGHMCQAV